MNISSIDRKFSFGELLGFILALAGLVYLYGFLPLTEAYGGSSLISNVLLLWRREEWQHCWLVPPAIVAMIWFQRKALMLNVIRGSALGIPVLVIGLLLFWLSFRLDDVYIGFISIQILIAGLILWFGGVAWMKTLIFPWLFLFFAWPFTFLDNLIAFPLRMIMSQASVFVLNFAGIPVILQGTGILSAPDVLTGLRPGQRFSVDVADPCSGIRSLFALMMVSALYGYFTLKEWWQKWAIFLCSIPLAILGNLCRILMLTFGTMAMGPTLAIGTLENPSFFHMAAGYVVFAVALGGMIGVGWMLQLLPTLITRFRSIRDGRDGPIIKSKPETFRNGQRSPSDPY